MGKRQKKRYRENIENKVWQFAFCFRRYLCGFWFFIPNQSMRLSFYNYSYITPERTEFVGFDNFVRLFHDKDFLKALQHTFLMVAVVVLLIAALAFLIAVLLDGNLRGKTFFRTVYYMPYVISAVAVSIFSCTSL
ncbi:MAG: carbohydrate ABC transporter permease [Lachnospiraceae bacterium]